MATVVSGTWYIGYGARHHVRNGPRRGRRSCPAAVEAIFKVRGEDQVLFRPRHWTADTKVEVFGPVFWELFCARAPVGWLEEVVPGTVFAIFLNPWNRPLADIDPSAAGDPASPEAVMVQKRASGVVLGLMVTVALRVVPL